MSFEYNVPYVDFVNEFDENDGADTFFDINSQLGNLSISEKAQENGEETGTVSTENEDVTPEENDCEKETNICNVSGQENENNPSLSENCKVSSKSLHTEESPKFKRSEKTEVLTEIIDTTQNIKNNKKRKSDVSLNHNSKFISLAEGVHRFQVSTPPRFHSSSKHNGMIKRKCVNMPKLLTIPQSPSLKTKTRSRPVDYPTAQEREEKEVEEIKSFKLLANPLNPKVFATPKLGQRMPKEPVVVEPFNLTEFKKKEVKKTSSPFVFKAKQVPKAILEHPTGIPEKKKIPITNPSTPSVLSKHRQKFQMIQEVSDGKLKVVYEDAYNTGVPLPGSKLEKTVPKPFSFEERTKMIFKLKEEKIKQVLQEEKEARIFHANPLPKYMKKMPKYLDVSQSTCKSSDSEEVSKPIFKAQPASVLYKQPFVPKKSEQSSIAPNNIVLHTEQRAKQRAEFDAALKEHYQSIEEEMRRRREREQQKAEEEAALLRQQTVIKANPIRYYKPVLEVAKASLTSP